jgi:uncharacterized membrane protein YdbT with pleckstrin-like domain
MVKTKKKTSAKVEKEVDKKLRHILYERAKRHGGAFKKEFKKHVIVAITAALGFLIALSWKEPILELSGLLISWLGMAEGAVYFKVVSALIVTVLAVLALIIVSKWAAEKE